MNMIPHALLPRLHMPAPYRPTCIHVLPLSCLQRSSAEHLSERQVGAAPCSLSFTLHLRCPAPSTSIYPHARQLLMHLAAPSFAARY